LREQWIAHLGEKAALDHSQIVFNPELLHGNVVTDLSVQSDEEFQTAWSEVEAFFRLHGTKCQQCLINPAQRDDMQSLISTALSRRGWQTEGLTVLQLQSQVELFISADLQVIPSRAGYPLLEQLMNEVGEVGGEPQLAQAMLAHLDDPHVDSLLAIQNGRAIATISVLGDGQNALIGGLGFAPGLPFQNVGNLMVHRALESCRRSLFKNVFTLADSKNCPAEFWSKAGFASIGRLQSMRRDSNPEK